MSCWQTLGIDASADKKSIKLAYAKRLKNTRPDDDPQGFIVLHQAYKTALEAFERSRRLSPSNKRPVQENMAATAADVSEMVEFADDALSVFSPSHNANFSENKPVSKTPGFQSDEGLQDSSGVHQPIVVSIPNFDSPELSNSKCNSTDGRSSVKSTILLSNHDKETQLQHVSTTPVEVFDYQQPEYQKALEDDKEFIRTRAYQLIASPLRINKIEEWKFIESRVSMLDLNFSAQVSVLLFEIVSKANFSTLRNGKPYINPPVLNYLNDYFQWDKNWKKYVKIHGRKQSYAVFMFTAVNKTIDQKKEPNSILRVLAYGVDITLAGVCLFVGNEIPAGDFLTFTGALYGLAGVPVLEASALQGSIGKRMFRVQVVDGRGQRMHWHRSFCRHYLTFMSLAFLQFTAIVNLVTYFKYGAFLQDKLTASYVIKRES